jgi:hypothetical protein
VHLQNLVTCHVPEDPATPAPILEFGVPSDQFLCSLLQHYGLKLHNLAPSGILHIVTFMTLCGTYMGIDPILSYGTTSSASGIRRTRHRNDGFGGMIIYVKYRHGVGPYFDVPMPRSMMG